MRGCRSFSSCLVTDSQEEEEKAPPKYAIKPPRDLTSRFEQEQDEEAGGNKG